MKKTVFCIGDSLTAGFPFECDKSYPQVLRKSGTFEVYNLGVNGESSGEILYRIADSMLNKRIWREENAQKIAVIMCGTNDFIYDSNDIYGVLANALQIAMSCKEQGITPIIASPPLCNPTQAAECWLDGAGIDYDEVNNKLQKYALLLRDACEDSRFNIEFLDLQKIYLDGGFVDGLHPDEQGYSYIGLAVLKKIKDVLEN